MKAMYNSYVKISFILYIWKTTTTVEMNTSLNLFLELFYYF